MGTSEIIDKTFYARTGKYTVPVVPKNGNHYNMVSRRYEKNTDFSLKDLKKAEKNFLAFKAFLSTKYGNAFDFNQDKPNSRVAHLNASLFMGSNAQNNNYRNLSLMTLNLQNGRIYNFPVTQIEQTFKISVDPKNVLSREGGNNGCSLKEGLKIIEATYKGINKIFEALGHTMSNEDFATILTLSRLYKSNMIVYNIDGWIDYIIAGKSLDTIIFGFNTKMFKSAGKFPFIPVDEVEEYEALPQEWLQTIMKTFDPRSNKLFVS